MDCEFKLAAMRKLIQNHCKCSHNYGSCTYCNLLERLDYEVPLLTEQIPFGYDAEGRKLNG